LFQNNMFDQLHVETRQQKEDAKKANTNKSTSGLTQRNKSKHVVSGVEIEDDSSDSDSDTKVTSEKKTTTTTTAAAAASPTIAIEPELSAGGVLIANSDGSTTQAGFAECQVLRIGAQSIGWQAAAQQNKKITNLRMRKRPAASPSSLPYMVMLMVSSLIAVAVPYFLSLRQGEHVVQPSLQDLVTTLIGAVTEQLKGFVGFWGDDTDETASSSGGGGANPPQDYAARMSVLASLIAIDQCKSLLHLGLTMLCYTCVGTRLLFQSCESTVQQYLAQRGALMKPKYSGITSQRIAEVDTVLFTHCSPRGIGKEDAAAIHRLKLIGLDIKVGVS
jgi:hypothetical protein